MKLSEILKKYNVVPDPEVKEVVSTIDKQGHGVLLLELGGLSPENMKMVKEGIKDAKEGRLVEAREDYSKYVEEGTAGFEDEEDNFPLGG